MSYIWSERCEDRHALLRQWSSGKKLVTAAVFFWNAGHDLPKSILGLLRSLVYQSLSEPFF